MEATMQLQPLRIGGVLDGKAYCDRQRKLCYEGKEAARRECKRRCNCPPTDSTCRYNAGGIPREESCRAQSRLSRFFKQIVRARLHRFCLARVCAPDKVASTRGGTPDEQTSRVSAVGEDTRGAAITRLQERDCFDKYVGEVRPVDGDGSIVGWYDCGRAKSSALLDAPIKVLTSKLNMELYRILWRDRRSSICIILSDFFERACLQHRHFRDTYFLETYAGLRFDDTVSGLISPITVGGGLHV